MKRYIRTAEGVVLIIIFILIMFLFIQSVCAETGTASWYSAESCKREGTSGIWTASGERFNENDLTCALRSRDFGKHYKVTNIDTGKSVVVKHNDFGPNKTLHNQGRIIDLSKGAFNEIADLDRGIIQVKIEGVKYGQISQ